MVGGSRAGNPVAIIGIRRSRPCGLTSPLTKLPTAVRGALTPVTVANDFQGRSMAIELSEEEMRIVMGRYGSVRQGIPDQVDFTADNMNVKL